MNLLKVEYAIKRRGEAVPLGRVSTKTQAIEIARQLAAQENCDVIVMPIKRYEDESEQMIVLAGGEDIEEKTARVN